ncbi:hypothetical protein MBLNU13_g11713t1 [Cladosporium sp. NU13]
MLDKILDIIARDGGITVFNLLPPELLNEYMTAIEPHMSDRKLYDSKATHEESGDAFFSEGSQRVHALLARMPDQLIKIMRLPVWQGIMARFLKKVDAMSSQEMIG